MEANTIWLNFLVNKNKTDFVNFSGIKWLSPYAATGYQNIKNALIDKFHYPQLFKHTKPYHYQLSRGCELCGQGTWSCLFITGKCNGGCFYCPTSQVKDEIPSTQTLNFETPDDYAAYVNYIDFKGVAFSGGEPLLYFDRTLDYLKEVREQCNSNIYTWMYTNGLLADKKKLFKLADQGLDEIRFDIGATGFNLEKVKLARGIVPRITVEIPAIPEEKDKLKHMLTDMIVNGVTNLNLHQLRLTPHNANQLIKRGYTIINAEKPIVLESELAALEIVNFADENDLEIGINYCTFHYKNRFQKAGFRTIVAKKILPAANLTENGYIREFDGNSLVYKTIKLSPPNPLLPSGIPFSHEVKTVYQQLNIPVEYKHTVHQIIDKPTPEIPLDPFLFKIWQFEKTEPGIREY